MTLFTAGYLGSVRERFESRYIPEPNSGCWIWMGACDRYGQMWDNGVLRSVTHISLELASRKVPKGMFACHHCDNSFCVNPDHLFIGTAQDNTNDAVRKGRAPSRQEFCSRGHLMEGSNIYHRRDRPGKHECRQCRIEGKKRWQKMK